MAALRELGQGERRAVKLGARLSAEEAEPLPERRQGHDGARDEARGLGYPSGRLVRRQGPSVEVRGRDQRASFGFSSHPSFLLGQVLAATTLCPGTEPHPFRFRDGVSVLTWRCTQCQSRDALRGPHQHDFFDYRHLTPCWRLARSLLTVATA
jgi:hypothetical protein